MLFSFFGLVPVRVQWKHCLLLYGQTQSSCVHNGLQHKKSYSPTGSWHLLVMGEKLFFCNSCYARLRHSWASVLCMHSSPHTTALIFARKCDSRPSCTWWVAPSVNATNAPRLLSREDSTLRIPLPPFTSLKSGHRFDGPLTSVKEWEPLDDRVHRLPFTP